MLLESILLIFLIATLITGVRLYFDLQNLKTYKGDFDKMLNKAESQLTDLEKIAERFRYISTSEKDAFQRLIDKAKTTKDDLVYLAEKSENILQKLSHTAQSIKIDIRSEENIPIDRTKEIKTAREKAELSSKKNKLINTIKDLR